MFGEFKVHIIETPAMMQSKVYLVRQEKNQVVFLTKDGTAVTIPRNSAVNTDHLYFAEMSPDQLQAFAQALADRGVKTNQDSVAEGKLTATERHLEDMRTIVLAKYRKSDQLQKTIDGKELQ